MPNISEPDIRDQLQQVFYTATFIVGIPANLLVIIIVAARRERRTANDIFILNLATSDMMYLFFCFPTNMYMMFEDIQYDLYCRLIWPLQTVTVCLSIFTLTSMAVFRCHVILNPFKPEMRHRYIFLWILGIWLLGLVLVIPLLLVTKLKLAKPQGCYEDWPSVPDRFANEVRRKENMQIIKTLAAIVILFAVCMLPVQLGWMLFDFGTQEEHAKVSDSFFSFSSALLYFHSCLNPIAYGTLTKHFRQGYIRFFSCIFCCGLISFVKKEAVSKRLSWRSPTRRNRHNEVELKSPTLKDSSTSSGHLNTQKWNNVAANDTDSLNSNNSSYMSPLWKESVV